jgi:hypothetical protein
MTSSKGICVIIAIHFYATDLGSYLGTVRKDHEFCFTWVKSKFVQLKKINNFLKFSINNPNKLIEIRMGFD